MHYAAEYDAVLSMASTENGGRHTPVRSGYTSDMHVPNDIRYCTVFFSQEDVKPGEEARIVARVLVHSEDEGEALSGRSFQLKDGGTHVADIKLESLKSVEAL